MTEQIDMSRFTEAKSDQLNSDDLIGISKTITVTKVTGNDGDQPISIFYQGDNGKPFKPCKTIRRVLMAVWGKFANEYIGRSMTLYRDDRVTFGGLEVGGIRISHMSHLDKETVVVVNKSKGKKVGMKILPLGAQAAAAKAGNSDPKRALDAIAACTSTAALRQWWKENSESIDDGHYDQILGAFNDHLARVKNSPSTATGAPTAEAATLTDAEVAAAFEGRSTSDMGEAVSLAGAIAQINACTSAKDVLVLFDSLKHSFDGEDRQALSDAADAKISAIKGQ